MKRVLVPLAEGFEEIEAVAIIDILRRAGIEVVAAGVGGRRVTGSHGITVECDVRIEDCSAEGTDAVALPGGMPGAANLGGSGAVRGLLDGVWKAGGMVAAICAAPTVLNSMGLLEGKAATSHPEHAHQMTRCDYRQDRVVVDGTVVTSRGAGTAIEFAAELVRRLAGPDKAKDILTRIVHA
jgi:4-methyl-5(b-hydroxyethyl)-thiazole monophosphate biosynthesis